MIETKAAGAILLGIGLWCHSMVHFGQPIKADVLVIAIGSVFFAGGLFLLSVEIPQ